MINLSPRLAAILQRCAEPYTALPSVPLNYLERHGLITSEPARRPLHVYWRRYRLTLAGRAAIP